MNRRSSRPRWTHIAVVVCGLWVVGIGCSHRTSALGDSETKQRALELFLPARVKIQPFTRVATDDGPGVPSQLILYVRPEDQFGDPVKVAGTFNFELYAYKQASAERKGTRIELWRTKILNPKDQMRYWDQTSQMYEFRLQIAHLTEREDTPAFPGGKAVLLVTYNTPWGEHLEDEYLLEVRGDRAELTRAAP